MNEAMQAQQRLILAMQNYQTGNLGSAEKELKDLRNKFPKSDQILALLGAVHFAQQKYKDSFRAYREALKVNPNNEEAAIGIGSVENARGNRASAIKSLINATRKFPKRPDAFFNLGMVYQENEDFKKAEEAFLASIKVEPKLFQAHINLVNIYKHWNKLDKTEYHLRAAIAINPAPELQQKLNEIIGLRGQGAKSVDFVAPKAAESAEAPKEEAQGSLTEALGLDNKDIDRLLATATDFLNKTKFEEAENCLQEVLSIDPDNEKARLGMRRIMSTRIPMWHFEMLADTTRNDAYQQAIQKALDKAPGSRVLDIGTGSGLLAMMAARAGASEVLACEMNKELARVATGIIKDNGYEDQIKVLNKKSSDLKKGKDFEGAYDIVVSEILDVGGLGEGVLPSLRHAGEQILKKGAVTIPSAITMHAKLVEVPALFSVNPVKQISGFDLSGFDQFRPVNKYFQIWIEKEEGRELSEPAVFKTFDFYNIPEERNQINPHTENIMLKASGDGEAHAVVFWFDLHLDQEIQLSSGPGGELKHWGQAICYLNKALPVKAGEQVPLKLLYCDQEMWFEVAD